MVKVLFFLLNASVCLGFSIDFKLEAKSIVREPGFPFEYMIRLYPSSLVTSKTIQQIQSGKVIPGLRIIDYKEDRETGRDADIVFIEGIAAFSYPVDTADLGQIEAEGVTWQVSLENIEMNKDAKMMMNTEFEYLLEPLSVKKSKSAIWNVLIGIVMSFLLIIGFLLGRKKYLLRKKIIRLQKERNELLLLISAATDRERIEDVYRKRQEIKNLFKIKDEEFLDFENSVNQYQFKKDWPLDEIKKAKEALNLAIEKYNRGES